MSGAQGRGNNLEMQMDKFLFLFLPDLRTLSFFIPPKSESSDGPVHMVQQQMGVGQIMSIYDEEL